MSENYELDGFDFSDLTVDVPKGNYRVKLVKATTKSFDDDEYGRNAWILNFVIDTEDETQEEFNGEEIAAIWVNFWPGMNAALVEKISQDRETFTKFKKAVKRSSSFMEKMGATAPEVRTLSFDFNSMLNEYFYADLWSKDGDLRMNESSIITEVAFDAKTFG